MTDKELRHLSRMELVQVLLEQTRETERLQAEVEELKRQLDDRRILMKNIGSVAEASLQINGVMEAAQQAADQYIENVKRIYDEKVMRRAREVQARLEQMERDTRAKCEQMVREAQAGTYDGNIYDGQ